MTAPNGLLDATYAVVNDMQVFDCTSTGLRERRVGDAEAVAGINDATHGRFVPLGGGVVIVDDDRVKAMAEFRAALTLVPALRAVAPDDGHLELDEAWQRGRLPR